MTWTARGLPRWAHLLDELCIRPDPIVWYGLSDIRFSTQDSIESVVELARRGFIERAGVVVSGFQDISYRATPAGRVFWEKHVKGKRKRPPGADPVPRHSVAQIAAATGPRDVFDLARVPWTWDSRVDVARMRATGPQIGRSRPSGRKYGD